MIQPASMVRAKTPIPERQVIQIYGDKISEFYGACIPVRDSTPKSQANDICSFLDTYIGEGNGKIPRESVVAGRVFAEDKNYLDAFVDVLKDLLPELPPLTYLRTTPCNPKAHIAFQYEAVVPNGDDTKFSIKPVHYKEKRVGTVIEVDSERKIWLRGILGMDSEGDIKGDCSEQADCMYKIQQALLEDNGFDYTNVSRVHIFLSEMATDYSHLNESRNTHFDRRKIGSKHGRPPPASTGIGIGTFPINALCISDIIAQTGEIEFCGSLLQSNTWDYTNNERGFDDAVNFSRLAKSDKVYVSGQSHIIGGVSVHTDNVEKAMRQTFIAGDIVLMPHEINGMGGARMNMGDAVSMIAYLNDSSNYQSFLKEKKKWVSFPFPLTAVEAFVCRSDLSYEHEMVVSPALERRIGEMKKRRRAPILDLDSDYVPPDIRPRFEELIDSGKVDVRNLPS